MAESVRNAQLTHDDIYQVQTGQKSVVIASLETNKEDNNSPAERARRARTDKRIDPNMEQRNEQQVEAKP